MVHRQHARCGGASVHLGAARPFGLTGSERHFERDRPFRPTHLSLDLTVHLQEKRISGIATLSFTRTSGEETFLSLDAVGFSLQEVQLAFGEKTQSPETHYDGEILRVAIPKGVDAFELVVRYAAKPRKGLYFLSPDDLVPSRPTQVWSQCQERDARYWFPCHDDPHVKMTTEIVARVPEGFSALSNGDLVEEQKPKGAPWVFRYAMSAPHASYLVTLVVGKFAVLSDTASEVPLHYYVPEGREEDARRTFQRTSEMIAFFGKRLGVPYPWSRYSQVVVSDFIFGGMENTSATTLYEHVLLDARASLDVTSDDLIAHELAHQWFGDLVTCRDWSEGWLNEGFATYMEHVWREHHLGEDEYLYGLMGDLDAYVAEADGRYRRPVVCREYEAPLELFDRHLYEKGGLVLHLLRMRLGDPVFFAGVRLYLERYKHGIVETRDLFRVLEEVSGQSLGLWEEQWLHRAGHPEVEVDVTWSDGLLLVKVRQTQGAHDHVPNAFEVALELEIVHGDACSQEVLAIRERQRTFAIPCKKRPTAVGVDPRLRILGSISLKAPLDMLRSALTTVRTSRARILAARALCETDDEGTIRSLGDVLLDERAFWGVRSECARALGKVRGEDAFVALTRAVKVKHPKVRRAVAEALGAFRTPKAVEVLRPLALRDESYLVEAEGARSLGKTREPEAWGTLVDVLDRPSWHDVIGAAAVEGLAHLRDDRGLPHLLTRVRYGHPARVRRAAVLSLPKLSEGRKTRETLELLLDDVDPFVRLDAVRALSELADTKARAALRERLPHELDARVKRRIREALRDLSDGKKGDQAVRDQLEKLELEHQELKTRLAKLEAKAGGAPKVTKKGRNK